MKHSLLWIFSSEKHIPSFDIYLNGFQPELQVYDNNVQVAAYCNKSA